MCTWVHYLAKLKDIGSGSKSKPMSPGLDILRLNTTSYYLAFDLFNYEILSKYIKNTFIYQAYRDIIHTRI
jgi:hypothetical protein